MTSSKTVDNIVSFACLICLQGMFRNFFKAYYVRGKSLNQHFIDYRAPTFLILLRDGFLVTVGSWIGIIALAIVLKNIEALFH